MTHDPGRWQRVRTLFAAALDLPAPERMPFLAGECGSDAALQDEVAALLSAHDVSGPIDRLGAELSTVVSQVRTEPREAS